MAHTFTSDLLTIDEASQLSRWTKATLYSKVSRRQIPVVRLGRSVRLRRSELVKLFKEVPALRPLPDLEDPGDQGSGGE